MMGSRAHGGARIGARRWRHARASVGYRPAPRSASIRQPVAVRGGGAAQPFGERACCADVVRHFGTRAGDAHLLAAGLQRMGYAVADWCGEDGQPLDDDVAPPRHALALALGTTAEALRDSRAACSASGEWSRRLHAEPFLADKAAVPPTSRDGLAQTVRRCSAASPADGDKPRHNGEEPLATWTRDIESPGRGCPMIGLTLTTIVVGYDGSPSSERALERAATLAPADATVTASPSLGRSGVVSETSLDSPRLTR